jgi:hypothetical protein
MRYSYHCPHCDQRSTRRWNLDVHIKRKHGGYLLGRSSGPNYPLFDRNGHATIADSVGNTFEYRDARQLTPLAVSQFSASPMYPPRQIMDDPSNRTGLSQDTIVKIHELKRLAYKYSHYCAIPDGAIRLAIYNSINSDNTLLGQMLELLRSVDAMNKY